MSGRAEVEGRPPGITLGSRARRPSVGSPPSIAVDRGRSSYPGLDTRRAGCRRRRTVQEQRDRPPRAPRRAAAGRGRRSSLKPSSGARARPRRSAPTAGWSMRTSTRSSSSTPADPARSRSASSTPTGPRSTAAGRSARSSRSPARTVTSPSRPSPRSCTGRACGPSGCWRCPSVARRSDETGRIAEIGPARGAEHAEGFLEIELDTRLDPARADARARPGARRCSRRCSRRRTTRRRCGTSWRSPRTAPAARPAPGSTTTRSRESGALIDWLLDGHAVLLGVCRFPVETTGRRWARPRTPPASASSATPSSAASPAAGRRCPTR